MDLSQPLEDELPLEDKLPLDDELSLEDDFPPFEELPPEAEPLADDVSMLDELPPEFGELPEDLEAPLEEPEDLADLPEELEGFPEDLGGLPEDLEGLPEELEGLPEELEGLSEDLGGLPEELEDLSGEFESLPEEFETGSDDLEALPEYIEEPDFDMDELDASYEDELLPDVADGPGEDDPLLDSGATWLEPDAGTHPDPRTPDKPPRDRKGQKKKDEESRAGVDPFGEEASRLYRYLKDLSLCLPPEKKQAMEASGVSAKLDAIIEHSAGAKPPVSLPEKIYGVPVSPRLAKLIEFMRREKHHGGK